ncbi:MAG: DNA polymerase III subunit delta' [Candidatus Schmidhempelia sp.]|nr:DNA polymerase III subunit delta' [Candidatus Schmidhempelia sp.]
MKYYPWLDKAYRQLVQPLLIGRAHHAWLIHYTTGSGERLLLQRFFGRLLCLMPKGGIACGHCHSCLLFNAGTHPDYYHIQTEKDKKQIGVEQIRKLTDKVYEHAQQGGTKVIWIEQATCLTEAAANALLKTLEEPPNDTYFILTENNPQQLMVTLRSRCSLFYLSPPSLDEGMAWLQHHKLNYTENQLATALLLNHNAPVAASELLTTENWQLREQFCEHLGIHLAQKRFWSLLTILNTSQSKTKISWFCSLLLDAVKAKNRAGKYITNRDKVALIRLIARFNIDQIYDWYRLWNQAKLQLQTISSLNQELILANMLAQSELLIE